MNTKHQPAILAPVPAAARYQFFRLKPGVDPRASVQALAEIAVAQDVVVGFGLSLLTALKATVPNMRAMPEFAGQGVETPATPFALWCWVCGEDRGDLLHKARLVRDTVAEAFVLEHRCEGFRHAEGRDLTGYEDGTENPEGEAALQTAFVSDTTPGLTGGSFVAVQQWTHDLDAFAGLSQDQQDAAIGRDRFSNEELAEAPESAHVKRTEQEGFSPEAFVLRRSMPWANDFEEGLMFVAFGHSFDAFEAQMRRMVGQDDGVIDGLFQFTRPVTGSYFWCPPIKGNQLDIRAVI